MNELTEKSMRATGAVRENRTEGANKQLIQNKELQKQELAYTITAVMEKYTLLNGMTTLL